MIDFILKKHLKENKNKIAIVDGCTKITYEELYNNIGKKIQKLNNIEIKKNSIIILKLKTEQMFIEYFFSILNIGAIPVLCPYDIGNYELNNIIKETSSIGIICEEDINFLESITRFEKYIFLDKGSNIIFAGTNDFNSTKFTEDNKIEFIMMSGGTTGIPKLVPIYSEKIKKHLKIVVEHYKLNNNTRLLSILPLNHKFGLYSPGILSVFYAGGTVIFGDAKNPSIFEKIKKCSINFISITPSLMKMLLSCMEEYTYKVDIIVIGGELVDSILAKKIELKMGCTLIQSYGMTEGVLFATSIEDNDKTRFFTQGKNISIKDSWKIVDELGNELEKNMVGEVLYRGDFLFKGYLNKRLNGGIFNNNYFKTGDMAFINDDGNIVIVGRKVEQINIAGEKVFPQEIEYHLKKIAGFKESIILGLPDEFTGERICAVIVTEQDLENKIIRKKIQNQLDRIGISKYKYPTQVVVRKNLPYTNVGKLDKNKLKEEIINYGK